MSLLTTGAGGADESGVDIINHHTIAAFYFKEGSGGTSASDSRAGAYTATLVNSPTWDMSDHPWGDSTCGSIVLNGTNQYITIADLLKDGPPEFTISLYIKPSVTLPTATGDRRIFWCRNNVTSPSRIDLLCRNTTVNNGFIWLINTKAGATTADVQTAGNFRLNADTWYNLTIVVSFGHIRIYRNGTVVASATIAGAAGSNFPTFPTWVPWTSGSFDVLTFGCQNEGGVQSNFLPAKLAEIIVERRAWTPAEVTQYVNKRQGLWTESRKWRPYASNPVLTATQAYEFANSVQGELQEPSFVVVNGQLRMFYTGGWTNQRIGFADSADGISFTKYASNPILGGGVGGEASTNQNGGSCIYEEGGTYYLYYRDGLPNRPMECATSTDGVTFTNAGVMISATAQPWMVGIGNTTIFKDGSTYYMVFEAFNTSNVWKLGLASATHPLGPWTLHASNPFTGLNPFGNFADSGAKIFKRNGVYHMWYHVAKTVSNLPTAIFRATASSMAPNTFTRYSDIPIMRWTGGFEVDQMADVDLLDENNGVIQGCAAYWTANDNSSPKGRIYAAFYPGTIEGLITDGVA